MTTSAPRTGEERDRERRRQQAQLELAIGTASALPQRPAGELAFPTFRSLLQR